MNLSSHLCFHPSTNTFLLFSIKLKLKQIIKKFSITKVKCTLGGNQYIPQFYESIIERPMDKIKQKPGGEGQGIVGK